ncbi:cupin domain-containing protein [Glacieibacterium megasporae]|uniref:cupin domain-containing protein n=1 Tax=Glacieibacterium megasporae TaxID=2835787 RepID=UPI001C1E0B66|nr:cupin domain-containing protein [Polymorphobacter megasporae]UAJ12971.1 cupin domain-containing protein [Polymorphobacter megasporae]
MADPDNLSAGKPTVFDLSSVFVHLAEEGVATAVPIDASFWENMDLRFEQGRMVSIIESPGDWPNWEMHPEGEELIYLLSGRMTLVLDKGSGSLDRVELEVGKATVMPRGVWHTADVSEPGKALYVTTGAGTQSRARTN